MRPLARKALSLFAALAIAGSGAACAAGAVQPAEQEQTLFDNLTDILCDAWYKPYIVYTINNRFFEGTSPTTFEPERFITRGEAVTVIGRIYAADTGAEIAEADNVPTFSDVQEGQYYTRYIGWAEENELVYGYPDGTFHPDSPITREAMAAILSRCFALAGALDADAIPSAGYEDVAEISPWARDAVDAMCYYEVFSGCVEYYNPYRFCGNLSLTRAEAAAVLTHAYQAIAYPVDTDTAYQKIHYYAPEEYYQLGQDFRLLGEEEYLFLTSYEQYASLVGEVIRYADDGSKAAFQIADESVFDENNILAVDLQKIGAPAYRVELTSCQFAQDTAMLTTFDRGLSGSTADILGYIFFIEVPKSISGVEIHGHSRIEDALFWIG